MINPPCTVDTCGTLDNFLFLARQNVIMQESFGFKRFPSTERKVSDIGPDDVRISIIGTIIDKGDGKLTIDDGTGSINVFTEDEKTKNFSIGNRVRVIGRVNKDNGDMKEFTTKSS